MIDRFITLFTNPWFWIIFTPVMALPYLLKYIRRFYPDNIQKRIIQCELKGEEYTKSGLRKRENNFALWGMLTLTILISLIYMLLDWLIYNKINIDIFWTSYVSPAFIFSLGILAIFYKKIYKYIFKDDYEKYQAYICDSESFVMKYVSIFGFLFILLSLSRFILI